MWHGCGLVPRLNHINGQTHPECVRVLQMRLRVTLLGVDEVRELGRVSNKENGGIVEDPIEIAFVCANLDGKPTGITGSVRRARLAANGGKANGSAGSVANLFKERGGGEVGNVMCHFKVAMCASTLGMDLENSR